MYRVKISIQYLACLNIFFVHFNENVIENHFQRKRNKFPCEQYGTHVNMLYIYSKHVCSKQTHTPKVISWRRTFVWCIEYTTWSRNVFGDSLHSGVFHIATKMYSVPPFKQLASCRCRLKWTRAALWINWFLHWNFAVFFFLYGKIRPPRESL